MHYRTLMNMTNLVDIGESLRLIYNNSEFECDRYPYMKYSFLKKDGYHWKIDVENRVVIVYKMFTDTEVGSLNIFPFDTIEEIEID